MTMTTGKCGQHTGTDGEFQQRGRNGTSMEMLEIRNPVTEMKNGCDVLLVGSAQLRKINQ